MADIIVRESLRALIPKLAAEELAGLESSILDEGCRDAIILWQDGKELVVVDGHNRLAICRKHHVPFKTLKKTFASEVEAKVWMIDNQMVHRRNLADIDRIALARAKEELLRPKAKENLSKGGKAAGKGRPKQPSANLPNPIDTRKESAKSAGVGERTYDAGKLILDAAQRGEVSQEDIEAIRRKEKSIHRVAKDLKEKQQKEKRQQARAEAAAKSPPQFFDNVHIGDFRDHFDKIADGSLSLIFTDPPYDRKAAGLYASLAEFGLKKLAPGGSLVTYVGHIQLPEAMASMQQHLRFWWTICCMHSGKNALMREYGIRVGWKPMLWFVNGTRDDKSNIVSDIVSGGEEKTHHDWQQSVSEAVYWISELCPKDGIVCDPFLGGGTTAAAAITCKRRWVGFEKDHDQAVIAMSRVSGDAA